MVRSFRSLKKIPFIIGALAVVVLFIVSSSASWLADMYWFDSLGYSKLFWKQFMMKYSVWAGVFLLYFIFLQVNIQIALRFTHGRKIAIFDLFQFDIERFSNWLFLLVSLFLSFIATGPVMADWFDFFLYTNPVDFGTGDPVFQKDIGFYFYSFPLFQLVKNNLIGAILLSALVSAGIYLLKGVIQPVSGWYRYFSGPVRLHLTLLAALFVLFLGAHFYLERFDILYSETGVVYGAGYTDIHMRLIGLTAMTWLSVFLAVVLVYSAFSRSFLLPAGSLVVYFVAYIAGVIAAPAFQQNFVVAPHEVVKERPFIVNSIAGTRAAYGLADVERKDFILENNLKRKDIVGSAEENIRLWDWRPLLSTYRQIQELRLYYSFHDVDIDRYMVNGHLRQVMLAPREFAFDQMTEQGKTWVNQRLWYTHGSGVVMSPLDEVTPEGLPQFFIKDIPPVSSIDVKPENTAVYYGELTNHYIFTGTGMDEFDYPVGDDNKTVRYSGKGGVPVGSFWKKALYAFEFGSIKILISRYFTPETRVHYHRNIKKRVEKVAPFLHYDSDPYVVISDGRLKWIIDAYTVSDRYPYSEPVARGLNYIRNSVKVVVDAYDGSVVFYTVDPSDPLVQSYSKAFPGVFHPPEEIPEDIRAHFRYPIDMFKIQAKMYLSYHMDQPELFYNREDMWKFPNEIYQGRESEMEPYYVVMSVDSQPHEFLLILPFTPANKNNMIAWMAARSDAANYGKLILYEFPKQELIYGPMQIEARIDQEPSISEVLTLWNQQGSSVIRGNLLVIPVKNSILYVEPLYLQSDQSRMPELKRVIVSYNNQIVMKETLKDALDAVFGKSSAMIYGSGERSIYDLANEALNQLRQGKSAVQQGRWGEFGDRLDNVEQLLQQMKQTR